MEVAAEACSGAPPAAPPAVSVIIPARDADATLPATLASVLAQDYRAATEVIVADGSRTPATADLLRRRFPQVRVVPNPEGGISTGLNRALRVARHPIIARCDAHAVFPAGYLTRAVGTLLRVGAANVGGRVNPVGATAFERAVALATTTPLAAGGARYRIGGVAGPVDTVFPGVYRRGPLLAAGGFDETLLRNEDYELELAAAGAWGDGMVRSGPGGGLPAPWQPAGAGAAVFRVRPLEAGGALPPSPVVAAPATGRSAAAGGAGRVGRAGSGRAGSDRAGSGRAPDRRRRPDPHARAGGRHCAAGGRGRHPARLLPAAARRGGRDRRSPPLPRGGAAAAGGGHHPPRLGARLFRGGAGPRSRPAHGCPTKGTGTTEMPASAQATVSRSRWAPSSQVPNPSGADQRHALRPISTCPIST